MYREALLKHVTSVQWFTPNLYCPVVKYFSPMLRITQNPTILRSNNYPHFAAAEELIDYSVNTVANRYSEQGITSATAVGKQVFLGLLQDPTVAFALFSPKQPLNWEHDTIDLYVRNEGDFCLDADDHHLISEFTHGIISGFRIPIVEDYLITQHPELSSSSPEPEKAEM